MRLEEIMTRRVETVSPRDSAESAREQMRRHRIHHLAVLEAGRVVGVLSQRDLPAGQARRDVSVREVMTSPAVSARRETTVRQAANLLRGRTIGCLPVVESGRLVGIVTATDLLELIGHGSEKPISKRPRAILASRRPARLPDPGRRARAALARRSR